MIDPKKREVDAAFRKVQSILHGEWDPIGCGVPLDEYDSYAWPVLKLLRAGAPRAELEAYLRWAADEAMSSPVSDARLARVLDQLLTLGLGSG